MIYIVANGGWKGNAFATSGGMSELRKATTEQPYFLTFTVTQWVDVFTRSSYCDILIDSLRFCQTHKKLEVYAYVIMTNHIHLIAAHPEGRSSGVIRDFKSFTAKQIIQEHPGESRRTWLLHMFAYAAKFQQQNPRYLFWQKTSHPTELYNATIFHQKKDYIHQNPVTAGYVAEAHHWYYSSAHPRSPLSVISA